MFKTYNVYVLTGITLISIVYIALFNGLTAAGLNVKKFPYQILYDYQLKKAENAAPTIAFVGDSSLGNAVNADVFSQLAGHETKNYALTGSFGLTGTLDMIKRIRNENLTTVVIMQTIDIFTRPQASTYTPPQTYLGLDLSIFNFLSLKTLAEALRAYDFPTTPSPTMELSNDYIRQGQALPEGKVFSNLRAEDIRKTSFAQLYQIADYCRKQNLTCLYAHGPVVESVCHGSQPYINAINQVITGAGLTLATPAPLCIPTAQLGDSSDHVRPPFKDYFTAQYYQQMAHLLPLQK